ncbi:MAG: phosphoribosyl-ATP pyrophosphohydrolase [Candidatus Colwellbacteria bacterium CG10_big_fil_rev_8_21_14_0_10_42_22]|uniref:Phosphoribosyl-ATP pyrophosphohydrolase n=1 Tax=Candidatus Colwellbacteria bacterium CG10_big_fil_rev_8_21_14_0_10_42_22 TaxID=1974540 RepID=A0A2H0VG77_9BACT|nr:MAG: phosphoribosyl-ATP pyrophosphohydrolase [Candidatus Colwellbacteria bacterium CG10_big_fil_rev_8_21_14_0_10_42_22]
MGKKYNKLVRDKIPEILDAKGMPYERRIATDEEYRIELLKKFKEESDEFLEVETPEELADVLEVIEALKQLPDYVEVEEVRIKKRRERGGFDQRIILRGEKG